jgi:hypothetical protein
MIKRSLEPQASFYSCPFLRILLFVLNPIPIITTTATIHPRAPIRLFSLIEIPIPTILAAARIA